MNKPDVKQQLLDFLDSKFPNQWLEDDFIYVYVRKANRYLDHKFIKTLDIANIISHDPNKGNFKNFLLFCESLKQNIYIESVFSDLLLEKLPKYGYTRLDHTPEKLFPSFYKIYEQNNHK